MALPTCATPFLSLDLPREPELSELALQTRLSDKLKSLRGAMARADGLPDAALLPHDKKRIRDRSKRLYEARQAKLAILSHLKADERKALLGAVNASHSRGWVTRDAMEERIAHLHASYPWLAPASNAVMQHMRLRTGQGQAAFHTPPLILLGPPGIAKSSWARALVGLFDLRSVEVDVGATNGATFSIAGVERGWGSATMGRVVATMLRERVANPLVILDEIDKIPSEVTSTRGGNLPGAFEVLKGMIEPSTARGWVCPYHQLPFDLTGVSWLMTTNSLEGMPRAFLDRCKVVRLGSPAPEHLLLAGQRMLAARMGEALPETCHDLLADLIRRSAQPLSLRAIERAVDVICAGATRSMLH